MTAEGLHSKQGHCGQIQALYLVLYNSQAPQLLGFLSCMKTKALTLWNSSALHSLSLFLCPFPPSNLLSTGMTDTEVWKPEVCGGAAREVMTVCILDKHAATEIPLGCLLVHSW